MLRVLMILLVGVAVGYFIGFSDAQTNPKHVVQRMIDGAGGGARSNLSNDVDSRLEKAGR